MLGFRPLPWEYGVRNLLRRPGRSALTLAALTLVVLLVFVVVAFLRGLEASLDISGDPDVVLVHSVGAGENVENSSVKGNTHALLAASLPSARRRPGRTRGAARPAKPGARRPGRPDGAGSPR